MDIDKLLHCARIHKKIQCFKKILIHESLEYKGLLLIQMAGVIVSRLSSDGFEELWWPETRVNIFDAKLSCYKSWEIFQLFYSFFRKPQMPALCIRL